MNDANEPASGPFRKLTRNEMHPRSGCQAKLPGCELEELLGDALRFVFGTSAPPNPMESPRDAAVLRLGEQTILVSNDFGPPVGIAPFASGRIAALHAMSDIFARGGSPHWALVNIV
jgi:selenophosphate synthase